MNNFQTALTGIVLLGISVVSGCGITLRVAPYVPVDLSKSRYASEIEKKSDELAKSSDLDDQLDAVKGYGSIGKLEEMDYMIQRIVKKNMNSGLDYSDIGDKYHKMHKKIKK